MPLKVSKTDVWAVEIHDQPGGLAQVMEVLAGAGANLQCVIGRRQADKPGTGVVFVTPLKGKNVMAVATAAGFEETHRIATLRVEGADRPGAGAQIARAIANAGVSLRGVSAVALGTKFVGFLGFDSWSDANRAAAALRALGRKK